jgi:4-hydroxyproline epimerase
MTGFPPVRVVDSHTAGEPTRVVVAGGPDLGGGSLAARRERFAAECDGFRRAVVCEPRGSDVLVGALLTPPESPDSAAGVVFFNNVGVLRMCGHGAMGVAVTLAHLGRVGPGTHALDTPVGRVPFTLAADGSVTLRNVPSYRFRAGVAVTLPGGRRLTGDVAWGGNWFFLCGDHGQPIEPAAAESLRGLALEVRAALAAAGITGRDGAEIDHVEFVGPPRDPANHARNFVLCPGGAWDRSPCGTGTSAKLACLHADGKLRPGEGWRQESLYGGVFLGRIELEGEALIPVLTGRAWVTAEATIILNPDDPYCWGLE